MAAYADKGKIQLSFPSAQRLTLAAGARIAHKRAITVIDGLEHLERLLELGLTELQLSGL